MTDEQHRELGRHILTELRCDSIHKLHHLFLNMFLCEFDGAAGARGCLIYAELAIQLEMIMEWPPEITGLIAQDAEIEARKIRYPTKGERARA
jgi:hypothetical protein